MSSKNDENMNVFPRVRDQDTQNNKAKKITSDERYDRGPTSPQTTLHKRLQQNRRRDQGGERRTTEVDEWKIEPEQSPGKDAPGAAQEDQRKTHATKHSRLLHETGKDGV